MRREGQVCGCCEEGGRGRCVDAVRREGQVCGCCEEGGAGVWML